MNASISRWYKVSRGTTGVLVVLLFWQLMSKRFNPLVLPSPLETIEALFTIALSGELGSNILITLKRTLVGYGLAIIAGFIMAVLLKSRQKWQYFFRPLITIIQTIPPVIWLVLAVIWFGIADNLTPVFLIFIVTFPVIFINVFSGLDDLNDELLEMAKIYRFNSRQVLLNIYLPSLIPHLVSAVSIGLAFAWKSSIFAEFIGSNNGIGFALSMAHSNLETEELFAWAFVLIILMLIFEYLVLQPLNRSVTGWRNHNGNST